MARPYNLAITQPVEIVLLDTPTVVVAGAARRVARAREQAVLARLALAAPRVVPVDVLVADIWGEHPPLAALDALRVNVSNLRKLMAGADRPPLHILRSERSGYRLDLPASAVDVTRLEHGLAHGDLDTVRALVGCWPDHDLSRYDSGTGFFVAAARQLDELRLAAVEAVAAADVASGSCEGSVQLLETALLRGPYRETLWELLVRALSLLGRRTEALRTVQRARRALAEVGVEPGPELAAAESVVLAEMGARPDRQLVSRYLEVDGSRIAFATAGSGPTDLLFLHGGFVPYETMRDTPRLAWFLDQLTSRFRLILLDRRGIGMSDGPVDGSAVRLDDWVADCLAVLDAVAARRVVVFGHEHGGPVAVRVAAERPDIVIGLVLHSTAARPLRAPDHPFGPSQETLQRIDAMIDQTPGSADMLRVVAPSAGDDPQLRAWIDRAGRLGAGPARAKQLHRVYLEADVRSVLPQVRASTIVLHPARMILTDPGQGRYLADHIPNSELLLLDSADHLFWVSEPDAAAVLDALDRLGGQPSSTDPPLRVRVIVAVAPNSDSFTRLLRANCAESLTAIGATTVATFDSISAAQTAITTIREADPAARTVLRIADTTGLPTDPALTQAAHAAQAETPGRSQPD